MIRTLLIANRGEIACRVIATARRLGIATVAVHSDADAHARHVAMADRAVRIGPPPAAESYLDADAILAAARATGADAIHPGYGFLSENPDFVARVEAAGLIFVGPPASAIRAMGLKDAAKALMEEAGVPVVPGYHGADQDPGLLSQEAERIGYPVLIKARAGGGGKGMRLVERPQDFAAALEGAQREGRASFGDPAVLVEKFVTSPRHVEIQVFADGHGNVVHLFERDCSLQRRHQKVIEEAPASRMPEEVRAAMGAAATQAAKAIGYVGAGTVEFIADGSRGLRPDGFWFMEMNTRLQVEHPVTEAITGLDLVEWQLRVASGEPLPLGQDDLRIDGHAFEARIYAEDVPKGFLPATGTLERLAFPEATEFARGPVRVDSGVREGDAISPWYDPMIAKLIVHGPTRAAALGRLSRALAQTRIGGTVTNLAFLGALARHEGFAAGEVDTGLIGRDLEALTEAPAPGPAARALAALAALDLLDAPDAADPWSALAGFRLWTPATQTARLTLAGETADIAVEVTAPGRATVEGADTGYAPHPDGGWTVVQEGETHRLHAARAGGRVTVWDGAGAHVFDVVDPLRAAADEAGGDTLVAPMPGLVKKLSAAAGDTVTAGQPLIVLEAMKMEHTLTAPRDGRVAEVHAAEGRQVADGAVLLSLEPEDG
ncbi:acetyl/propionyl/methylcrotonyl-CoA carboxylase subunit alpha [Wenxinia marina]|uniref:Acetyl/propionyl-CoA carboxylase, alpha subunit n=1 Tax=Wenxinia marina DSM 24838 TaxID=1123501 RepID=A0A0D0PIR3_9RHOB|nr:acetyl/propionyl/methylcrotonyl-CoA carboxylase subunit alpha [Wenxinia marina]KIQ71246.1 Acetyl/propionyl-CoA carboxylase, alpha subunit [Wenxinia marina DSM 24838]GGL73125.1 3-methylcrotonyl-CoA carboxylase subunit alpha [Wenxinia marina]